MDTCATNKPGLMILAWTEDGDERLDFLNSEVGF